MRNLRAIVVGAMTALAVSVPVALASHLFDDVPNSNPHHDDVTAMRNAGITAGCSAVPSLYCPDQAVRRDQMATFLRRGLARVGAGSAGSTTLPANGTSTIVGSVTITTGGAAGGAGFVRVSGSGSIRAGGAVGCPCTALLVPSREGAATGPGSLVTRSGLDQWSSYAVEWVFPVQTATTYTFTVRGQVEAGTENMEALGNVVAEYIPLGSTGGSTLGTS